VSGLVIEGAFRLIFGPTHLRLRWEILQSFSWAVGFSSFRWLVVRDAAESEDEQD
jgi:hypothetical protein